MARRQALANCTWNADSNPGLWFNKYSRSLNRESPQEFNRIFEETAKFSPTTIYKLAYERRKLALESASAQIAIAKSSERLAVGLGIESSLETSIALEPTYGVPIIPGSALKGVAAFFARQELEGWEIYSEAYRLMFGFSDQDGEQQAGCVVFHDAWPDPRTTEKLFQQDVINVHHPEYYQNAPDKVSTPPADWDNPVPISFLTTKGSFLIAVSGESQEWLRKALEILKMALEEYGVGSKTSRGYGRLNLELPKVQAQAKASGVNDLIQELRKASVKDKSQFNQVHVTKWDKLPPGDERIQFGKAILAKVKELGWERDWAEKAWLLKIKSEVVDS